MADPPVYANMTPDEMLRTLENATPLCEPEMWHIKLTPYDAAYLAECVRLRLALDAFTTMASKPGLAQDSVVHDTIRWLRDAMHAK